MKKVIAVDIDDVLAVGNDAVRRFANLRYGHQHTSEDYLVPEALAWLKRYFDLIIVTAREAEFASATHAWLERHFPDIFHDVAFVTTWTGSVKDSKADICRELRAEYLIDDNIQHLQLASEAGIKGLLFGDYGWSKNKELPPRTVRVADWKAVKEFFRDGTGQ